MISSIERIEYNPSSLNKEEFIKGSIIFELIDDNVEGRILEERTIDAYTRSVIEEFSMDEKPMP